MIVSNATPLIAFARIGQLGLLQEIVKSIVIPKAVALEISTYDQDKTGSIYYENSGFPSEKSLSTAGFLTITDSRSRRIRSHRPCTRTKSLFSTYR